MTGTIAQRLTHQRADIRVKAREEWSATLFLEQHAADLRAQHMRANHARLDDKTSRKRAAHAQFRQVGIP